MRFFLEYSYQLTYRVWRLKQARMHLVIKLKQQLPSTYLENLKVCLPIEKSFYESATIY